MNNILTRSAAVAFLGAVVALLASPARAEPDVLERPATRTAKAASSVMLGIAQAGPRLVAVGERGIVVYSDDAGASWRQADVPVSASLVGARFVTPRDGWAVGHSGVLLRTADGGQTWRKQLDGKAAAALVLAAVKAGRVAPGADAARLLADAERLQAEGPSKPFLDIHFFDQRRGVLAGAFGLLFATDDGGATWQAALDRIDNPQGKHLYALAIDGERCVIAGEQGAVFLSNDGGRTFATATTPYAGTYFGAIAAGTRTVLFGMRGNVYWSDGGAWQKSAIGTEHSLTAGLRLKDGSLLLTDETGQLFRSADGGKRFAPLRGGPATPLTGVAQAADGNVVVSGVRGVSRIALNPLEGP
jgi:photosystem II stability/assembly factor-like uncharacterized protein